jgi:hypothetical protein
MTADIVSGNTATADVFFLIAVILAVVAALASVRPVRATEGYVWAPVAAWLAVAFLGLGWLVL